MPKDDYFRLQYRILEYLYGCMRAGEDVVPEAFGAEALGVNDAYWQDIMTEAVENGYVKHLTARRYVRSGAAVFSGLDKAKITEKGIEHLKENSNMKKVHAFLKGVMDVAPGA